MTTCASCGLPGHRYGRNEGPKRYDPMACINSLRGENERLLDVLQDIEGIVRDDTIASKGLAVLDRIAQVFRPSDSAASIGQEQEG